MLTVGRDEAGEVGGREVIEEGSWLVGVLRIWGQKAPPEVYFKIPECVRWKSLGHSGGRGGVAATGSHAVPNFESPSPTAKAQLGEFAVCLTFPFLPGAPVPLLSGATGQSVPRNSGFGECVLCH